MGICFTFNVVLNLKMVPLLHSTVITQRSATNIPPSSLSKALKPKKYGLRTLEYYPVTYMRIWFICEYGLYANRFYMRIWFICEYGLYANRVYMRIWFMCE